MENVFEGLLAEAHKHLNCFEHKKQAEKIKNDIINASQRGYTSVNVGDLPPFIIDELKKEGFEVYPKEMFRYSFRITWA